MSHSKKGNKGPGYEYWSKKYNGEAGKRLSSPGKDTKQSINRAIRRKKKQEKLDDEQNK